MRGVLALAALYVLAAGVLLGVTAPPLSGGTLTACVLIVAGGSLLAVIADGGGPRWL